MSKPLLTTLAAFFIVGLVSMLVARVPDTPVLFAYLAGCFVIAEYLAVIVMLRKGTFYRSGLFKVALFLLGLMALGIMFKILHLPGADQLLLVPYIPLLCVYGIHVMRKRSWRRLDVLKLLTAVLFVIAVPLSSLHLISEELQTYLEVASHIIVWVTFADFLYETRKQALT